MNTVIGILLVGLAATWIPARGEAPAAVDLEKRSFVEHLQSTHKPHGSFGACATPSGLW